MNKDVKNRLTVERKREREYTLDNVIFASIFRKNLIYSRNFNRAEIYADTA